MKIKRYLDVDMRKVLRRVREDQGPDAVILSNRRTADGIEVIAAVDYDESILQQALGSQPGAADYLRIAASAEIPETAAEPPEPVETEPPVLTTVVAEGASGPKSTSMEPVDTSGLDATIEAALERLGVTRAGGDSLNLMRTELTSMLGHVESRLSELVWQEETKRFPMRAQMLRNLARIGISSDIANRVIDRLKDSPDSRQIWRAPLSELIEMFPVKADGLLAKGGVVALIGPTGVGKTTSIAKIAARYAMVNGSDDIALICADAYRIGAQEHLAAFGQIIGVPVHAVTESRSLSDLLDRLRHKKLVLIDTDGVSQRDADLSHRLETYRALTEQVQFYLTLSAASQERVQDETIRRFSAVPLAGAVISKIDESGQLGGVISALIRHELPAVWFSDGQRIPDDLHEAPAKRLWLMSEAIKCMEASDAKVDEHVMAERQTQASVAYA